MFSERMSTEVVQQFWEALQQGGFIAEAAESGRHLSQDGRPVAGRARREFPDSDSVRVFRALTLNDAQRPDEAVAELLTVVTGHAEVTDLGRWAVELRGLAQWLADGRPIRKQLPCTRPPQGIDAW
jgi:hypothetical protein